MPCFKGWEDKKIAVTPYGAKWVKGASKHDLVFDQKKIKAALKFLMSSCFFTLGNLLFKQVIGIHMGSDPAPFMANLFLYYYENKWLKGVKGEDLITLLDLLTMFVLSMMMDCLKNTIMNFIHQN